MATLNPMRAALLFAAAPLIASCAPAGTTEPYRSGGNLVYRNDLKNSCPGLARDSDIMVVRQFGSSTCEGDFFHLVDRSSGIRGPTCVFGEFVPYRKPAGDAG